MRILILGTGGMAKNHADAFKAIEGVEVVAACDVSAERVDAFSENHGIHNRFTRLENALRWGHFDAVANVTPDAVHHSTSMMLIGAGKHIFCEKPLAENYAHAAEMAEAAEQAGVINMVNLSYRNVAALQKARRMVLAGDIGQIRHFEASYLQSWLASGTWGDWKSESKWLWRLSRRHGSNGVLGDVGIHILDFASHAIGSEIVQASAHLKTFDKAENGHIGEYVLDANDSFVMMAEYANEALGVIHASRWATGHLNELRLRVHGDKGALELLHTPETTTLRGCLGSDINTPMWREIEAEPVDSNYQRFARAVAGGVRPEPGFRHAANLQRILDHAMAEDAPLPSIHDGRR